MSFIEQKKHTVAAFLALCSTLIIFSYVLRIYQPHTYAHADIGWQMLTVQSLAEDGDLDFKNQLNNDFRETQGQASLGKNGEWFSLHEILMPILALPFWKLLGVDGCLIFNILIAIATTIVTYYLSLNYASIYSSFVAALLTLSSSLLLVYSYSFSGDLFGAFLFLLSYYQLTNKRFLSSGFFWGLAVLARMLNVFTFPAMFIGILLLTKKESKTSPALIKFLLAGVPAFLFFCIANYQMFGHPLKSAYQSWLIFDDQGNALIKAYSFFPTKDLFKTFFDILFNRQTGLFISSPLLFLAFGLCFSGKKITAQAIIFILISLSFLLFATIYCATEFGYPGAYGNRYLISVSLLSAVPLAIVLDRLFNKT